MAQEKRSMGEDRVQEALDLCLARMRRGESPERCLVDFADLAEELRPLLLMARDLHASRDASIPAPPAGMMAGRERFLDAARRMRADEQASAASEAELAGALDTCLTRIATGEPVERVLAAYPAALAAAMRPLVDTSLALAATPAAPPPPGGLAAGRARFLATAGLTAGGVAATAKLNGKNGHAAYPGAEQSESDPAITEALDTCLARIRAGERSDIVLAAFSAALADQLRPLVAAAGDLMDSALPAPPAPGGLAAGRARFLDVAARSEAHRAAVVGAQKQAALTSAAVARVTFRDRFFGNGVAAWMPGLMLRASSAAMLAVVLFFGGVLMVRDNAAIAGALPGDPAYLIKRLNEQIDLLTTFDPVRRGQIEQAQDEQRAAEVDQLLALGREADVSLRAAFLGYEIERLADGSTRILLRLRVPPTGDGAERVIVLGDGAALDLGGYARVEDLPAGAVIGLTLRTGSESGARALARSVQLVALPPVVVGPGPAPSAAAEPTLVLRVAESRGDLRTVQPIVPATSSAVLPHQPGTATATDPPPPTATQMPTVEVTVAASAAPSRKVDAQKIHGVVIEQPAADLWLVATDGCTAQKVVRVNIGQISDYVGVPVLFKVVHVSGKFENAEKNAFIAAKLRGVEDGTGATESEEIGTVLALPGDGTLTLAENGRSYRIDTATVVGDLKVGATVTVRYQSCGGGTPVALAVNVHSAPVEVGFAGQVADLVPNVSFTLIIEDADPETPDRITVNYDAGTSILGLASSLANGQRVEVQGEMEGDEMRATGGIIVTELPAPLIWDPGEPPPAATYAPTPAPTSETIKQ